MKKFVCLSCFLLCFTLLILCFRFLFRSRSLCRSLFFYLLCICRSTTASVLAWLTATKPSTTELITHILLTVTTQTKRTLQIKLSFMFMYVYVCVWVCVYTCACVCVLESGVIKTMASPSHSSVSNGNQLKGHTEKDRSSANRVRQTACETGTERASYGRKRWK